ncbi:disulfide isomerase pTAC5, chloroplastic-like protein [Drosera capensis]
MSALLLTLPIFHDHHHNHHRRRQHSPLPLTTATSSRFRLRLSATTDSDQNRNESLWLREESRWLREEQRWLREEQRWNSERESLLREVQQLRASIEALEGIGGTEAVSPAAAAMRLLELKESGAGGEGSDIVNLIAESGESVRPLVIETRVERVVEEKAVTVVERKTLRFGAEGDDVRAMQEALQALGFYSGEEDMEYSSFASGTERAVKTWQSSLGVSEDGVMTAELLETLYASERIEEHDSLTISTQSSSDSMYLKKDGANGAVSSSIHKIAGVQQTRLNVDPNTEVDITKHRVFLLGENRWEEPSRLISNNKQPGGTLARCMTCRGERRLLCTECDGTGDANLEPQFLEWVGDGAKCPYCEGLGYTICDMCEAAV